MGEHFIFSYYANKSSSGLPMHFVCQHFSGSVGHIVLTPQQLSSTDCLI
jgi:hypothetical protein